LKALARASLAPAGLIRIRARHRIRRLLESENDFEIAGDAASGLDAAAQKLLRAAVIVKISTLCLKIIFPSFQKAFPAISQESRERHLLITARRW